MDAKERAIAASRRDADERGWRRRCRLPAEQARELLDGRMPEQRGERQGDAGQFAQPGHEANREERVPAQREEVVGDADRSEREQLLPELDELQFESITRDDESGGVGA